MTAKKKTKKENQLVVTLIGKPETEKIRKVVWSMGLRKLNRTKTYPDCPEIRGMIFKAKHLLKVEEIGEQNVSE
jgi:ribosomal protein L30